MDSGRDERGGGGRRIERREVRRRCEMGSIGMEAERWDQEREMVVVVGGNMDRLD